jgi:DNA-directed RNA polymerase subunit RPC12/RpoP
MMKNCDTHCSRCGTDFPSREEYIQHLRDLSCSALPGVPIPVVDLKVVKPLPRPPTVKLASEKGTRICSGCGLPVKFLEEHQKSCPGYPFALKGEDGYRCANCGKTFDSFQGVTVHHRRAHPGLNRSSETDDGPFPCDHPGCSKVCSTRQGLAAHRGTHFRPLEPGVEASESLSVVEDSPLAIIRELTKLGYSFELSSYTLLAKPRREATQ